MNWEGTTGLVTLLILIAIVPGPSDLLVAGCAVRHGLRSAWSVVFGIVMADLILIGITVLGLTAILSFIENAVAWMEAGAALVLIGFGVSLLLAKGTATETDTTVSRPKAGFFSAGFAITFLDPKALLFYFGILPTFLDMETFGWDDAAVLFALVTAIIILTKGAYAWLAVRGMRIIPNPALQRYAQWFMGLLLIAVGISMIAT